MRNSSRTSAQIIGLRKWGGADHGRELRDASDRQSRDRKSNLKLKLEPPSRSRVAEGKDRLSGPPPIPREIRGSDTHSPRELGEWKTLSPSTTSAKDSDVIAVVSEISNRVRFLAVRWAAKEAAYQALFPNYTPARKDLSVSKEPGNDGGKPQLVFGKFENVRLHVSVSHDEEYIVANVLAED